LEKDKCFAINFEGTSHTLVSSELYSKFFIHISTDFVFDGVIGNYNEEDETSPISWYGNTKQMSEKIVREAKIPWAIVRTCLVYGNSLHGTRSNIITWVKNNLEQSRKIRVVDDQWRTPTYVRDLARGILLIIEKKATGTYHISGKDLLTPYDMALQTARLFNLNSDLIEKVNASTFSQTARRPLKTGLDISKARKELNYEPMSFEEGLREMFGR
jgi:dTDP-4-dehydrorhamnose reductase